MARRSSHAPSVGEAELAAITPTLFARPARWRALVLHADARRHARAAPWSAWWALRLAELADPAADRLDARFGADEAPWPNAECGAEVMACGTALRLRAPNHPRLAGWAARAAHDVLHLAPGPPRLKLATFLLHYHVWRGEFGASALVADSLPGIDWSGVRRSDAFSWLFGVAVHARYTGAIERGHAAVRAGLDLLAADGAPSHAFSLHLTGAALAITAQDAASAARHLDAARSRLDAQSLQDQTHYWYACTGLALLRGDGQAALALARSTLAQAATIGGPYRTMVFRFAVAAALWAVGDMEGCAAEARSALDAARAVESNTGQFSIGLLVAQALARCGRNTEGDVQLAEALAVGAGHDYVLACGGWLPDMVAASMARALALGLHTDYVRRFVRRARLPCPDPTLQAWPWPLMLRGFGNFEVRRDGAALATAGPRLSQRPLDLLRVLLAHDGTTLPVRTVLDWLWPEAERGQQRKAFDAALLRLRRALADDTLLRLEGAQLRLDTTRCWSDVKALADTDWSPAPHAGDADALFALGERLLALARGPLLDGIDEPWANAARERARRRVAFAIEAIAGALESESPERAGALYERALVADPLAEVIARRLIALQLERGERDEALRAWMHLKAMLALHGEMASASTRALVRRAGLPD